MFTQRGLVEKFRRGERITKEDSEYSLFTSVNEFKATQCGHLHMWRCIVCWDSEADIVECLNCGKQAEHPCNFDDDFS